MAAVLLLAVLTPPGFRQAGAHEQFTTFIQHHIDVALGAKYLDLTVELSFFEEWSEREREAMDQNHDGQITRTEVESYVKGLAPTIAKQVTMRLRGQELPLAPLYAPEVDLLGNDLTGRAHHRLRLFFFAATPTAGRAGEELIIEDRLWGQARALGTVQAEGQDGWVLEAVKPADPAWAPALANEPRQFRIKCLKLPVKPPHNG